MRVELRQVTAGQLTEFGARADADQQARVFVVAPDRQRRPPIPRPAQRPVDVVVQPVAVASVLDVLGIPVGGLILAQQRVLDLRGADVPGRLGVVDQRGVAAPAMRVGVRVGQLLEHQPALDQIGHQHLVCGLEELAPNQGDPGIESTVAADRGDHFESVLPTDRHVLGAVRGCLVHQTGAVGGGDVVGEHHEVRLAGELDQLERTLVVPVLHLGTADGLGDVPDRAAVLVTDATEHCLEQRPGHHEVLAAVGGPHVVDPRVHRHRGVADQRPRGGRPHQHGRADPRAAGEREADEDRRVDDILVALRDLMIAQRGLVLGAVRRDPVVLDQQTGVEDLLERPPDRFDVVGGHRPVGLVEVYPVAHPVGQLGELVDVTRNRLAAHLVELLNPEVLDLGLAVQAQFLLDRQFHGQAVAVPAGLAVDPASLHGLEAGEDVLEDPGLNVVGAGMPIRGGWAFEEGPRLTGLGGLPAAVEGVVALPLLKHLVVHGHQVELGRNCAVAARLPLWGLAHRFVPCRRRCKGRTPPLGRPRYHPCWDAWRPHSFRAPRPVLVGRETPAVLPTAPR